MTDSRIKLFASAGPAIHDVTPGFSLEELLDENPLFSSQNGRISIVSRVNTLPKCSSNQMKKTGHQIEFKDPASKKKSPDEIIDEILKAGFYQHSKIFKNSKFSKKIKIFRGQQKPMSRENH